MPDINVNKLSEALNTKADIDLNNTGVFSTSSGGVNLTYSTPTDASGKEVTSADFIKSDIQSNLLNYTTNRILEIPQDIKWRTNLVETGKKRYRLTILKGSVYYVPQGFEADGVTRKFSKRTMIADNTCVDGFWSDNALHEEFVFLVFKDNTVILDSSARVGANITSGETAPTTFLSNRALWYDTKNNYVKFTENSGTTWYNCSLPLLKGSPRNTIDETHPIAGWVNGPTQIFNGFGYIGSTVFALPGVKVLIPNGKNEDGTYKSFIYTVSSVLTCNIFNNGPVNGKAVIVPEMKNVLDRESLDLKFDSNTGYMSRDIHRKSCIIANVSWTTSGINSFESYSVDSIANSNASNFSQAGKSYLSSLGMPSKKYINLTLGASGNTYTAPANGWFNLMKMAASQSENIHMITSSTDIISWGTTTNVNVSLLLPVSAGDIVKIAYTATGNVALFRFIYAKGDQ